jgi:type VI secretion system (T6SS) effector TldE1-like protein
MLRPFVGAVVSAAGIAACVTFGLEGLNAAISDRASQAEQSDTSAKAIERQLEAVVESGREGRPAPSSVVASDVTPGEGVLAISADASEANLLSKPFARWDALVLFESGRLDGGKTNPTQVSEAATAHPTEVTNNNEPAPPLPRPRPVGEQPFPTQLASATQAPEPAATPRSPWWTFGFLQNIFQFGPKRPAFPAEASGRTAVYDIETHAVYLPTGEILEAHSGLGKHIDDVRYVQEKSRGPTPPNVYALTLRERPFHGVQAIRLTPVNDSNMFGRDGILAHPYMLGPNGESNGCVSIQNYKKFLQAYLNGQIDRIIVVPRLASTPEVVNASATERKRTAAARPI